MINRTMIEEAGRLYHQGYLLSGGIAAMVQPSVGSFVTHPDGHRVYVTKKNVLAVHAALAKERKPELTGKLQERLTAIGTRWKQELIHAFQTGAHDRIQEELATLKPRYLLGGDFTAPEYEAPGLKVAYMRGHELARRLFKDIDLPKIGDDVPYRDYGMKYVTAGNRSEVVSKFLHLLAEKTIKYDKEYRGDIKHETAMKHGVEDFILMVLNDEVAE